MNNKVKQAKSNGLFAEIAFPDNQTILQVYGNISAEKLKAMVAAINEVITDHKE